MLLAAAICCLFSCNKPSNGGDKPEEEKLASPINLTLEQCTQDQANIRWDAVSQASSYSWKLLKGMTLCKDGSCSSNSLSIDALEAGTTYRFAVKSINDKGSSSYSEYLEFSTLSESNNQGTGTIPDPLGDVYKAMQIPEHEEDGIARAFPGAEGGGMYVTGGRGGKVIHVTTLEDISTEGSLRWAIAQKGERTIVFDVAGTITLKSPLEIKNGDLTIAGQTAPGDGICIKGRYTIISADNVILRFLRFRLGDEDSNANDNDDALWCRYHKNIIIDHCSMSWGIDECASFYANENFTLQWSYVAESMRRSKHSKGDHGYGGIWGGKNISFHHNMLAHHDSRNPRFDHPHIYENHNSVPNRGAVDFRNNVVYNWGSNNSYGGEGYGAGKGEGINMIANYYKPGPSSNDKKYFLDAYSVYSSCSSCGKNIDEGYPLVYMEGNIHTRYSDISSDNSTGIYWHNKEGHANYNTTSPRAFEIKSADGLSCKVSTHSAQDAFEMVCSYGGASLSRDRVDERTSFDARNGKGCIIDCVTETEGKTTVSGTYGFTWPNLRADKEQIERASIDNDGDGIPDYYEHLLGLNATDPSDAAAKTIDPHGRYTNLEMYLHYLVKDIVKQQNQKADYK